jgi:Ca2+-binding RTX toxin-like protein
MGTRRRSSCGGRWTLAIAAAAACAALLAPSHAAAGPKCAGKKATIVGKKGRDALKGSGHADVIVARAGNDRISAGGGRDLICAGAGADSIHGGAGRDVIYAGGGDDRLTAGPGSDKGFGEQGNDLILGGPGGEHAVGGAGDDRIHAGQQDDDVFGSSGDDLLIGDHGYDRLRGGSGDDWLREAVRYDGGPGNDWASFATTIEGVTGDPQGDGERAYGVDVNLNPPGAGGDSAYRGIENVVGTPWLDEFRGVPGQSGIARGMGYEERPAFPRRREYCSGFATADCGPGFQVDNDRVTVLLDATQPDPGVHVLGSGGNDALEVSRTRSSIEVRAQAPIMAGPGCNGGETRAVSCPAQSAIGYVVAYGHSGDDTLAVTSGFGQTTSVVVDGGTGSDRLLGGPSDEQLFAGSETFSYGSVARSADYISGGGGDDALAAGHEGPDALHGGPGSDQLITESPCSGHVLDGGPGGSDIAGFAPSRGVRVRIGGSAVEIKRKGCRPSKVSAANEILEGSAGDDVLTGDNGPNSLVLGGRGNDLLYGLGGADRLRGDAGRDTMWGGAGNDVIEASDGEHDRLLDCGPGGGRVHRDSRDPKPRRCG